MGCSESLRSEILLSIELNIPIFKIDKVTIKSSLRTTLRDLCKKIISNYINPNYTTNNMTFKIYCKDHIYTINDFLHLYELKLEVTDVIKIEGIVADKKSVELIIKSLIGNSKEEELVDVDISTHISYIIPRQESRVILGDLELEHSQRLEDYDIFTKTKLIIIDDNGTYEDVQL